MLESMLRALPKDPLYGVFRTFSHSKSLSCAMLEDDERLGAFSAAKLTNLYKSALKTLNEL